MKIVIAPDSFKGNLTSLEVASAIHKGVKKVDTKIETVIVPMWHMEAKLRFSPWLIPLVVNL